MKILLERFQWNCICFIVSTQRQQLHIIAVLKTCVCKVKTSFQVRKQTSYLGYNRTSASAPQSKHVRQRHPQGSPRNPCSTLLELKCLLFI